MSLSSQDMPCVNSFLKIQRATWKEMKIMSKQYRQMDAETMLS